MLNKKIQLLLCSLCLTGISLTLYAKPSSVAFSPSIIEREMAILESSFSIYLDANKNICIRYKTVHSDLRVEVYNLLGSKITEEKLSEKENFHKIATPLAKGVYVLRISSQSNALFVSKIRV